MTTPDPISPAQMRELVATLLADQWVDYKDYPKDRDIAHALESAASQLEQKDSRIAALEKRLSSLRSSILDCFEQEYNERDDISSLEDLIAHTFTTIKVERRQRRHAENALAVALTNKGTP